MTAKKKLAQKRLTLLQVAEKLRNVSRPLHNLLKIAASCNFIGSAFHD
ncbi:MAG: hypothetical protein JRI94_18215 [Deltaproteobacteria bacterium]|nr:hypothetical protein [Deltaproteobacteria bacterium]